MKDTEIAVVLLHYTYPIVVFGYYIITTLVAVMTLQDKTPQKKHVRHRLIQLLLFLVVASFFGQFLSLMIHSILKWQFLGEQDTIIGLLSCVLVFGIEFNTLAESDSPVWHPYTGSFGYILIFDPAIQVLSYFARPEPGFPLYTSIDIVLTCSRVLCAAAALIIYLVASSSAQMETGTDAEREGLLSSANGDGAAEEQTGYSGTATDTADDENTRNKTTTSPKKPESAWERRNREAAEKMAQKLKENGNWFSYTKRFAVFLPYIWPLNNRYLQTRIVMVGLCLLAKNAVNLLIPRQLGIVMDTLNDLNGLNPWVQVIIYAALRLVASDAGLSLLRQWLWIPVQYYAFDAMSTAAYSHVLNLSSDFHDTKSSSDIMMAIQSGQSVSNMLESICFSAVPMLIDMVVAFIYLSIIFGPYESFITVATAIVFLAIATRMIARLKDARRGEIGAYFEEHYVRQAGIQGWSTVTCFNQVEYEEGRYSRAVKDRVAQSQKVYLGYIFTYALQFLVLLSGLLAGAFLAVYQVKQGKATPGNFVMLLTYWAQLIGPLNFFANMGKNISKDLIHAEQLLEIMQTKPTVTNKPGAKPLALAGGQVRLSNVYFSYDKQKEILKDVSLEVEQGTTVAFVGATGAGKSTILKLLDRFYDVTQGSIEIDGQDIRDVDISSLRSHIGIVPQSPILFDDTIMNNVRYARLDATDEEVFEACKAASIHEQVLTFADGYETRVGERGIKLSGGELQRVAIARAILKRPSIVLLDEATSAVDTETEQRIQEALRSLCQGRTTFIVAHRLSTIMNADRIIVVSGGEVIEEGNHESLIKAGGKYADLWSKQIFVKAKAKGADDSDAEDDPKATGSSSPTIVNDLTAEEAAELCKVGEASTGATTPVNSKATDGADDDEEAAQNENDDAVAKTPPNRVSGHKKEESRLNPDAPAFTPRSRAAAGLVNHDENDHPGSTVDKHNGDDRSDRLVTTPLTSRHLGSRMPHFPYFPAPLVMVPTAAFSLYHHPLPHLPTATSPVSTRAPPARPEDKPAPKKEPRRRQYKKSSGESGATGETRTTNGALKTPRYSRRIQSKSEPFSGNGSPPGV